MRARFRFLIFLAFADCATTGAHAPAPIARGATLPDVALKRLDQSATTLAAEIAGRIAVVSFWATWCDACKKEGAALGRLDAQLRASGGVLISVDVGESPALVAPIARAQGFTNPQLVDENFTLADAIGSRRVPTTLIIDATGKVAYTGGALDSDALAALRQILMR